MLTELQIMDQCGISTKAELTARLKRGLITRVDDGSGGPPMYETVETADKATELEATPARSLWGLSEQALRESMTQTRDILALVIEPSRRLLEMVTKENAELRDRIAHLERSHDEAVKAREEALSEALERQLAKSVLEGQERRKDELLAVAKEHAPAVLKGFAEKNMAAELFSSMTPKQAWMLRDLFASEIGASFLTKKQVELICELLPPGEMPEDVVEEKEKKDGCLSNS